MAGASQERDLRLIGRIRAGEAGAKEELVRKYLPMVRHIARGHYAAFLDLDDLLQEGVIGLLQAAAEYRPDRFDVKFSSFAYLCILRKIYNVIKHTQGTKHRALNDAVSLHAALGAEESRTFLEISGDASQPDPAWVVEEKLLHQHLDRVLRQHLSLLEYTVARMLLLGFSSGEIQRALGLRAKVVDNARTRIRLKLQRILDQYGTLLHPKLPGPVRRRRDLYVSFPLGGAAGRMVQ